MNRRLFAAALGAGILGLAPASRPVRARDRPDESGAFVTRGVVLTPEDLSLGDWPERAKRAGLTTIGIHHQNSPPFRGGWRPAR